MIAGLRIGQPIHTRDFVGEPLETKRLLPRRLRHTNDIRRDARDRRGATTGDSRRVATGPVVPGATATDIHTRNVAPAPTLPPAAAQTPAIGARQPHQVTAQRADSYSISAPSILVAVTPAGNVSVIATGLDAAVARHPSS